MANRIGIIDHVGNKAGMDCYDSSLMKGLYKHGCQTSIYSNFIGIDSREIAYHPFYEGHSSSNYILRVFRFLGATCAASYTATRKKTNLVILHLFTANPVSLMLVLIPKIFKLKIAVISHDVSSFLDNDSPFIQNIIYNYLSDFVIVHNRFSYDSLVDTTKINNTSKIKIIKHGGYLDHIGIKCDRGEVRKELGLEVDGKYILFFGQIKRVKGLDILIEAFAKSRHQDTKLIIAGRPWNEDFTFYQELIDRHQLNDRIILKIRFIEDSEREKLFLAANVNVLPYRVIFQSGVLLMAMSYGLPVIASDLPPNTEIIRQEKNGMLFKSEDPNDLALMIDRFWGNSSLPDKMAKNAIETIKSEYSWHDISLQYLKMMDS